MVHRGVQVLHLDRNDRVMAKGAYSKELEEAMAQLPARGTMSDQISRSIQTRTLVSIARSLEELTEYERQKHL